MNTKISLKDSIFKKIGDIADTLDIRLFVVGGYVRDLILDIPSKDIDIVCIGNAIDLANEVAKKLGIKKVSIYKNFGVSMIKYNDLEIEFITARKESYHKNSRKPEIKVGNLSDDQNRRDFTINSLAISLNKKTYGDLIDPFDGLSDLEKKNY